jgi:xanthine dehydrogenase YagT iron-sulfur-binding subunit
MSESSSGGDLRDGVVEVTLTINGRACKLAAEPRMTLLDALREELLLTGTKKGCDRGECGACTVHIEGRRALSCMTLAAMQDGKRITTIEGLQRDDMLHPLQAAFIEHDGFQCGFCTSGQIMSGVAMIDAHATVAAWDASGGLTLYETTQHIFGAKELVSIVLGVPFEKITVVSHFLGGGFGGKATSGRTRC